jgi:hypothetical protein
MEEAQPCCMMQVSSAVVERPSTQMEITQPGGMMTVSSSIIEKPQIASLEAETSRPFEMTAVAPALSAPVFPVLSSPLSQSLMQQTEQPSVQSAQAADVMDRSAIQQQERLSVPSQTTMSGVRPTPSPVRNLNLTRPEMNFAAIPKPEKRGGMLTVSSTVIDRRSLPVSAQAKVSNPEEDAGLSAAEMVTELPVSAPLSAPMPVLSAPIVLPAFTGGPFASEQRTLTTEISKDLAQANTYYDARSQIQQEQEGEIQDLSFWDITSGAMSQAVSLDEKVRLAHDANKSVVLFEQGRTLPELLSAANKTVAETSRPVYVYVPTMESMEVERVATQMGINLPKETLGQISQLMAEKPLVLGGLDTLISAVPELEKYDVVLVRNFMMALQQAKKAPFVSYQKSLDGEIISQRLAFEQLPKNYPIVLLGNDETLKPSSEELRKYIVARKPYLDNELVQHILPTTERLQLAKGEILEIAPVSSSISTTAAEKEGAAIIYAASLSVSEKMGVIDFIGRYPEFKDGTTKVEIIRGKDLESKIYMADDTGKTRTVLIPEDVFYSVISNPVLGEKNQRIGIEKSDRVDLAMKTGKYAHSLPSEYHTVDLGQVLKKHDLTSGLQITDENPLLVAYDRRDFDVAQDQMENILVSLAKTVDVSDLSQITRLQGVPSDMNLPAKIMLTDMNKQGQPKTLILAQSLIQNPQEIQNASLMVDSRSSIVRLAEKQRAETIARNQIDPDAITVVRLPGGDRAYIEKNFVRFVDDRGRVRKQQMEFKGVNIIEVGRIIAGLSDQQRRSLYLIEADKTADIYVDKASGEKWLPVSVHLGSTRYLAWARFDEEMELAVPVNGNQLIYAEKMVMSAVNESGRPQFKPVGFDKRIDFDTLMPGADYSVGDYVESLTRQLAMEENISIDFVKIDDFNYFVKPTGVRIIKNDKGQTYLILGTEYVKAQNDRIAEAQKYDLAITDPLGMYRAFIEESQAKELEVKDAFGVFVVAVTNKVGQILTRDSRSGGQDQIALKDIPILYTTLTGEQIIVASTKKSDIEQYQFDIAIDRGITTRKEQLAEPKVFEAVPSSVPVTTLPLLPGTDTSIMPPIGLLSQAVPVQASTTETVETAQIEKLALASIPISDEELNGQLSKVGSTVEMLDIETNEVGRIVSNVQFKNPFSGQEVRLASVEMKNGDVQSFTFDEFKKKNIRIVRPSAEQPLSEKTKIASAQKQLSKPTAVEIRPAASPVRNLPSTATERTWVDAQATRKDRMKERQSGGLLMMSAMVIMNPADAAVQEGQFEEAKDLSSPIMVALTNPMVLPEDARAGGVRKDSVKYVEVARVSSSLKQAAPAKITEVPMLAKQMPNIATISSLSLNNRAAYDILRTAMTQTMNSRQDRADLSREMNTILARAAQEGQRVISPEGYPLTEKALQQLSKLKTKEDLAALVGKDGAESLWDQLKDALKMLFGGEIKADEKEESVHLAKVDQEAMQGEGVLTSPQYIEEGTVSTETGVLKSDVTVLKEASRAPPEEMKADVTIAETTVKKEDQEAAPTLATAPPLAPPIVSPETLVPQLPAQTAPSSPIFVPVLPIAAFTLGKATTLPSNQKNPIEGRKETGTKGIPVTSMPFSSSVPVEEEPVPGGGSTGPVSGSTKAKTALVIAYVRDMAANKGAVASAPVVKPEAKRQHVDLSTDKESKKNFRSSGSSPTPWGAAETSSSLQAGKSEERTRLERVVMVVTVGVRTAETIAGNEELKTNWVRNANRGNDNANGVSSAIVESARVTNAASKADTSEAKTEVTEKRTTRTSVAAGVSSAIAESARVTIAASKAVTSEAKTEVRRNAPPEIA